MKYVYISIITLAAIVLIESNINSIEEINYVKINASTSWEKTIIKHNNSISKYIYEITKEKFGFDRDFRSSEFKIGTVDKSDVPFIDDGRVVKYLNLNDCYAQVSLEKYSNSKNQIVMKDIGLADVPKVGGSVILYYNYDKGKLLHDTKIFLYNIDKELLAIKTKNINK